MAKANTYATLCGANTNNMEQERVRLARKVKDLQSQYNDIMRGRLVPNNKALRLQDKITELKELVDNIDRRAAQRINLQNAPIEDVLEVIAIPLLADVMNDIVAGVDGMLIRNGCQHTVFGDYVQQIRRAALAMVDTLSNTEEDLPKLLDVDDTLVDAVRKKLMSFIRQRLRIKDSDTTLNEMKKRK